MRRVRLAPLSGAAGAMIDAVMLMAFTIFVALVQTLELRPETLELPTASTQDHEAEMAHFDATVTITEAGVWIDRVVVEGGVDGLAAGLAPFQQTQGLIGLCLRLENISTVSFWALVRQVETAAGRSVVHICTD